MLFRSRFTGFDNISTDENGAKKKTRPLEHPSLPVVLGVHGKTEVFFRDDVVETELPVTTEPYVPGTNVATHSIKGVARGPQMKCPIEDEQFAEWRFHELCIWAEITCKVYDLGHRNKFGRRIGETTVLRWGREAFDRLGKEDISRGAMITLRTERGILKPPIEHYRQRGKRQRDESRALSKH